MEGIRDHGGEVEGERELNRYVNTEGKWLAPSQGSTRARSLPEEDRRQRRRHPQRMANERGREVEGLEPDDAKFKKEEPRTNSPS